MKKLLLNLIISVTFLITSGVLLAAPGIITIHGFSNFEENGSAAAQSGAVDGWANFGANAFSGMNVKHLAWDSSVRMENQKEYLFDTFIGFINSGHCDDGCYVFTHSTGGLVIDYMLSISASYPSSSQYFKPYQYTTVVVDLASAGGGVNLAAYASDLVNGACWIWGVSHALEAAFPFLNCNDPESIGVGYDLQPNVARSINGSDYTYTPTLMIAGSGSMALNIVKPFLYGTSDGLVAMHSGCGGNRVGSYDSCSSDVAPNGAIKGQSAPSGFYRYHYPYIMTTEGHLTVKNPSSTETETLISNRGLSNISTENKSKWYWRYDYSYIKNDERNMGQIIGDHFNF